MLVAGCGTAPRDPPRPPAPRVAWRYHATEHSIDRLEIDAIFESAAAIAVDEPAMPFVRDVAVERGSSWTPVARRGASFPVACPGPCRVRYVFDLLQAARSIDAADTAIASGHVVFAPPSTWLLHPGQATAGARFELQITPAPGSRFLTGVHAAPGAPAGTFAADVADMEDTSFAAFGPFHAASVRAGDATIQVGIAPHDLALADADVLAWVRASAGAVASYYQGHPPAKRAAVLVMRGSGGPTRGLTLGGGGPATLIRVGDGVTAATTRDDWVVTHELLHVNFPDLGWQHAWLTEGLATYVEPVARARVGLVDPPKVWRDLIDGLPQGLPQPGDQGLEKTRTWGRTYWGGALFCLLADVTLRERTGGTRSLDTVLRAIGNTGATDEIYWDISRVIAVGDQATGTHVLQRSVRAAGARAGQRRPAGVVRAAGRAFRRQFGGVRRRGAAGIDPEGHHGS